jgi:predicted nucleic acid-binding Zn ribbon protein
MTLKNCKTCGVELYGRSDKKFCSDSCRNVFNNGVRHRNFVHVRRINNILHKNRRLLEILIERGKSHIPKRILEESGYNFCYYTSHYTDQSGNTCIMCYEYGYTLFSKGEMEIFKRSDEEMLQ